MAESEQPITCLSGLKVIPDYTFVTCPYLNVLVIPGAKDTQTTSSNQQVIDWIRNQDKQADYITSVCTGSLILQKAGLLPGRKATTHWDAMSTLTDDPSITPLPEMRYVRDGKYITAQGVSAGIDMALWLIGEIHNPDHSRAVRRLLQYDPGPPYTAEV